MEKNNQSHETDCFCITCTIEWAKNNNIPIMQSTIDLADMYGKYIKGTITTEQVIKFLKKQ